MSFEHTPYGDCDLVVAQSSPEHTCPISSAPSAQIWLRNEMASAARTRLTMSAGFQSSIRVALRLSHWREAGSSFANTNASPTPSFPLRATMALHVEATCSAFVSNGAFSLQRQSDHGAALPAVLSNDIDACWTDVPYTLLHQRRAVPPVCGKLRSTGRRSDLSTSGSKKLSSQPLIFATAPPHHSRMMYIFTEILRA